MEKEREWLTQRLAAMAEPQLAVFNRKLIPGLEREVYGIRVPRLRALARELVARPDWREVADAVPADAALEELMVKGMTAGYARLPWQERWERICGFVGFMDNWAVCDCCCSTYTAVRRARAEAWPDIVRYAASPREYDQRFAAVMLMDHFKTIEELPAVLDVLAGIRPAGYYAAMGVGWAFATCFVYCPELTWSTLSSGRVPEECSGMAFRKILESRRTPEAWRAVVRQRESAGRKKEKA